MGNQLTLTPPEKVTVVESIIEQLIAQIGDGNLNPGDRLPSERDLADMLAVSRSSVREALQGLAAMNVVAIRPGEGTFVQEPEAHFDLGIGIENLSGKLQKEMREQINLARSIVEMGIVTEAARRLRDERADGVLQALEAYEAQCAAASADCGGRAHDRLHLAIAKTSGNRFLEEILQSLLELVPRALRDAGLSHGTDAQIEVRLERELHIHRQLCEALIRGDEMAAREWMERHVDSERALIEEHYLRRAPDASREAARA